MTELERITEQREKIFTIEPVSRLFASDRAFCRSGMERASLGLKLVEKIKEEARRFGLKGVVTHTRETEYPGAKTI